MPNLRDFVRAVMLGKVESGKGTGGQRILGSKIKEKRLDTST